jgi:hypothetical protein
MNAQLDVRGDVYPQGASKRRHKDMEHSSRHICLLKEMEHFSSDIGPIEETGSP